MPTSSRELVRALFSGKPVSRIPFIPCLSTAAARFMQIPVQQMLSDPTALANSLQSCQRLFKYDGVVIPFDDTLEAEACGCRVSWAVGEPPEIVAAAFHNEAELKTVDSDDIVFKGRIPAVIEAVRRLAQTIGRDTAILGAITGPVTMGNHLTGKAAASSMEANSRLFETIIEIWSRIALSLVRIYGELKVDAVIVADRGMPSIQPSRYTAIQPAFKTVANLVRFYDAPVIIHLGEVSPEALGGIQELDADGFSIKGTIQGWPAGKICGRGIPSSTLSGSEEDIDRTVVEMLEGTATCRSFLTSEWEIPEYVPAANLHKIKQVLDNYHIK